MGAERPLSTFGARKRQLLGLDRLVVRTVEMTRIPRPAGGRLSTGPVLVRTAFMERTPGLSGPYFPLSLRQPSKWLTRVVSEDRS